MGKADGKRKKKTPEERAWDYLRGADITESEIRKKTAKQNALQSCLIPSGQRLEKDHVQTSPSNKFEETMAEILDLEKEIRLLKDRKSEQIRQITATIGKLENEYEQEVLLRYFIGKEKIRTITRDLPYERSQVYNIRNKGVRHIAVILGYCGHFGK